MHTVHIHEGKTITPIKNNKTQTQLEKLQYEIINIVWRTTCCQIKITGRHINCLINRELHIEHTVE